MNDKPNLLVLGVGHTGTSVLAKMIARLGWNVCDADEEFAESERFREFNRVLLGQARGTFRPFEARAFLARLPAPWVLKDPRLVRTLPHWIPLFGQPLPVLVYLTRNEGRVRLSYRRREATPKQPQRPGKEHAQGLQLTEMFRLARQRYREWPGAKVEVSYEQLAEATALFEDRT